MADSIQGSSGQSSRLSRPTGLQTKFLIGVGLTFLFFCFFCAFILYQHEKSLMQEEAYTKSRLLMAAVESSRSYVRDVLRPRMYEVLGDDSFVLEAMSTSYVGRAVMDRFNTKLPDYHYRRVALGARNPDSEPKPFEIELINFFSRNPGRKNWQGIVRIAGQSNFLHASPVYFDASCLRCHGNPEEAPEALLEMYGRERGFGKRAGEIAGISAVSIPVDVALAKIKGRAMSIFSLSFLVLTVLYVFITLLFNRVVVHSLRDLLEVFRGGLREDTEIQLLKEAKAKDEIGELTAAAQVMSSHLSDTRKKLEDYAQNLELMVVERTQALEQSQQSLREQVEVRKRELRGLITMAELITQSVNLREIWPKVLEQTLELIPASGAALYLLREDPSSLKIQCRKNADKLDEEIPFDHSCCPAALEDQAKNLSGALVEAACGRMSFFPCRRNGHCLSVPLACRGEVLGVMTFVAVDFSEVTPEMRELLVAVGQQIGITIDSLQNVERLITSKDLLQSVFEGITDMMVLLDRERRIKMVNRAYLEYYGVKLEDVLDRACWGGEGCGQCPFEHCSVEEVLRDRRPATEEVKTNRGEIFQVRYYPILDAGGEVTSIVRYAENITAHKRVEQRIQQTEKLASLGQLAAGIAHEINNPLGVILCYTDLLKRELAGAEESVQDVATIEKHTRNCRRIVSDLLNFSRGQETEKRLEVLNPGIEEVAQMLGHQFRRQNCEIDLRLAEGLPDLYLDSDRMKQVYLNLLMNALQAFNGPGRVVVETSYDKAASRVRIVVEDNGMGIPSEIQDRIFDPFFSTKETGEGTGLGLSVSYGIIEDHGGEIRVESRPGSGARFTIWLPVEPRG